VPEAIDADISNLEIGMSLRVSDLVAPKGATILTDPEESVVAVQQPQMAVELEEEEALAAAEALEAAEGEGAEGAEGEAAEGEGAEGSGERSEG
jgi:large subunit ribosomal protein L25